MKKTLIAAAALAVSAGAMAQNVSMYGVVDVALMGTQLWNGDSRSTTLESGGVSGSRLGFVGSEDLGGGLKALFKYEAGFDASSGESGLGGTARQAYVGLQGNFGTVTFGQVYSAMDDIYGANNSGFDSALSATVGVLAQADDDDFPGMYIAKPTDAIRWESPAYGPVSLVASHAFGSEDDTDVTDIVLKYAQNNATVNVGYQTQNDRYDWDSGTSTFALNGSYDFGSFKLMASYAELSADDEDFKVTQIGVDVPLSAKTTLSVGYADAKDSTGDYKASGVSVAASHSLSKRTSVYAGYRDASTKWYDGYDSDSTSAYAIGLKHTF